MKLFNGLWIQGQEVDYGDEDELYYKDHHNVILKNKIKIHELDNEIILRIAVLGYYAIYINDRKVSDYELNNDWTNYTKCVYYDEYSLNKYLNIGTNDIKIELGNGMYNPSPLKLFGKYNLRDRLAEVGQPKVICDFISNQTVLLSSDASWTYSYGQYLFNNLYLGEKIDLNYIDKNIASVITSDKEYNFKKSFIPKIKKFNTVKPTKLETYKEGIFVDFKEMISGFINLKVKAKTNQEIILQYSEHSNGKDLNYATCLVGSVGEKIEDFIVPGGKGAPVRAIQSDTIICKEGLNEFTNQLTYHSFRYVYIIGCKIEDINEISATYVHSDLKQIGTIDCDNEDFNNLYHAAMRTKLNNVHSVFEDCARERLGYGGDIVALATSNLYSFDLENMYNKVIKDFRYEQTKAGGVPETAPYVGIQTNGTDNKEGPILWQLVYPYLVNKHYQYYGDITLLKEEYPYLIKQLDYLLSIDLKDICNKCIGDHGSILIAGKFREPTPDKEFLGYCTILLFLKNNISVLKALNKEYQKYQNKYNEIKEVIINKFLNNDGSFAERTQTGYAFAIYLQLGNTKELLNKFIKKIKEDNYIFNSGIYGMSLSYEVLAKYGYNEIIENWLLLKDNYTYLNMLASGNKALAELFVGEHLSLNHAMFSSYVQWYYQGLGGIYIDEDAVAFNSVTIKPYFATSINNFECKLNTKQGLIISSWKRIDNIITWSIQLPDSLKDSVINLNNYNIIDTKETNLVKEYIIQG